MATNPNDIAKALNQMMDTLKELSDTQLASVESIIRQQKKLIEDDKKTKEATKKLDRIKKEIKKRDVLIEKEETKTLKLKKNILKSLTENVEKIKSKNFKMSFDKSPDVKDLFKKSFYKSLFTKPKATVSSEKKSQSLNDYIRKSDTNDIQEEQLKVLREIDSKIDKLSQAGSGSIFDLLINGFQGMLSKALGLSLGGLGAAGGLGALGGLGKLGGLLKGIGKAGRLGRLAKVAGGALKAKSPILMGAILAGGIGYGAYKAFSGEDEEDGEEVSPRKSGGVVKSDSMYLVGERGPELFSPDSNGSIIPNHKLFKNNDEVKTKTFDISFINEFKEGFTKNLSLLISTFNNSFKKFGEIVSDGVGDWFKSVKDDIKSLVERMLKIPGTAIDKVKEISKNVMDRAKSFFKAPEPFIPKSEPKPYLYNPASSMDFSSLNIPQPQITINSNDGNQNPTAQVTNPIIQNNVDVKSVPSIDIGGDITQEFWLKEFIPSFKNAIKIRPRTENNVSKSSSDPFGL